MGDPNLQIKQNIKSAKKRLGIIYKRYKYLEFLALQLNIFLVKGKRALRKLNIDADLDISSLKSLFNES